MDPITLGLLIGGGTGLAKSFLIDKPRENRQRQLAASTQMYSPWTGMKANTIQEANPFGDTLSGAATGAQVGAGIEASKADSQLKTAMGDYFKAGGQQGVANQRSLGLGSDFWTQKKAAPWSLLSSR